MVMVQRKAEKGGKERKATKEKERKEKERKERKAKKARVKAVMRKERVNGMVLMETHLDLLTRSVCKMSWRLWTLMNWRPRRQQSPLHRMSPLPIARRIEHKPSES